MAGRRRICPGGVVHHVINGTNRRAQTFHKPGDHLARRLGLQLTLRPKAGPLKAKDDRNAAKPYSYCGTKLMLTVADAFSFFPVTF
ncbi:MAG TPA: hypothetical protein VFE47_25535 [Tepidisphaeraceae bacterium]|nr:hypothetical protein [Tepidisphaeraceae bacterium]